MNTANYNFGLIYALVILVVFLVSREFFCWYLKTTENVKLLKDIKLLLIDIKNKLPNKEKEESKTDEME